MKKDILIFLGLIAMAGIVIFIDPIWKYFSTMGPLEAIQQIFTFILHVVIVTICVYVVTTLPEIVKPWMKVLKLRAKWESGPNAHWRRPGEPATKVSSPRLTNDQKFMMMLMKMSQPGRPSARPLPHRGNESDDDQLHLQW